MTTVRDLLKTKSIQGVLSIGPNALVVDAIQIFCEKNVGSLVVLDQGIPVGFINERELLMLALRGSLSELAAMTVKTVMARKVIIAVLDDEISYVSAVMNKNKIRHLPIIHQKEIVGLLSLADVVDSQMSDEKFENKMLHNYIEGNYPG